MFNNLIIKVMKKIFILAAVTAIALTACTKTETTAVSEGNLIKFDNAFVGNVTKADITKNNFATFWVYGSANTDADNWADTKFTNSKVTKGEAGIGDNSVWSSEEKAYWTPNADHFFAAYANGTDYIADASLDFDAATSKLTFNNYTAGDYDLVAAVATKDAVTVDGGTGAGNVAFSFVHMLSKVKFTFNTEAAHEQVMKVSDLKFTAVKTTSGDITSNNTVSWTTTGSPATAEYIYDVTSLEDFAAESQGPFFSEMYVIPQGNTSLTVSFKVTWKSSDAATEESGDSSYKEATFRGNLSYDSKWQPGYSYNYIATINPEDVNPALEDQQITFQVDEVKGWESDTEIDVDDNYSPTTE